MYQQMTIVGNLGSDPEMRYTASGVPVTSFNVAVNRSWTNQEGQRQDKTTWFRVTAWRKLAETASQYLSKGRQVLIVGEIEEPEVWVDRRRQQPCIAQPDGLYHQVPGQPIRWRWRRDGRSTRCAGRIRRWTGDQ